MSTRTSASLRRGMTLVEIMVACTLLATGIFAGVSAIANAQLTASRRQNTDLAIAEIQNQFEVLQAMTSADLAAFFPASDKVYIPIVGLAPGDDPNEAGTVIMPQAGLIERVQVPNGPTGQTCIRIAASWIDHSGQAWIEQYFFFTDRY